MFFLKKPFLVIFNVCNMACHRNKDITTTYYTVMSSVIGLNKFSR